jgi:hypothetical protein
MFSLCQEKFGYINLIKVKTRSIPSSLFVTGYPLLPNNSKVQNLSHLQGRLKP